MGCQHLRIAVSSCSEWSGLTAKKGLASLCIQHDKERGRLCSYMTTRSPCSYAEVEDSKAPRGNDIL
ncbi:hypothetical protein CBR_g3859 [Chara braunii]|uniref:Uncharacterized protein n=1 Tax=Chara braunii TaxID=69332 RepID=A0A388KGJ4_CHABU|nr:hypothetical protein CBR_g3859 [Chara braunii]|eukprot:GBG69159.1 hypothetical protein CBR_g3859 [Chara braunii]